MFQFPHLLADDFPEYVNRIEALKAEDAGFARLLNQYNELNRDVVLAETNEKPTDHFHEEEMKKQRALLKDEIYTMLNA